MLSNSLSCELVIPRAVWERSVPQLLTGQARFAFGRLRRNEHSAALELLLEDLHVTADLPEGRLFPPLADWAVLLIPAAAESFEPGFWLPRFRPLASQFVAVGLVGLDPNRSGWQGWTVHENVVRPLAAIRIVGPGMLRAERQPYDGNDNGHELFVLADAIDQRWSRTRGALGDAGLRKIRATDAAVVGASRTGSALAFQLAALGVRRLTLIDPDVVELHNLDSSVGLIEKDVGRPKVQALAARLVQYRSDLAVHALDCPAGDPRVIDAVRSADLLVTCVDSDTPRLVAALLAGRFLKLHLDVGTGVTAVDRNERLLAGDVRLLLPGQGCVCCVGGLADEQGTRQELLAPTAQRIRRQSIPWYEQRAGSLVTLNMMTVAIAVQHWLDLLSGKLRFSYWSRLRWQEGAGLQFDSGPVNAVDGCPNCRPRRRTAR